MSMPGFTAEHSLLVTREPYRGMTALVGNERGPKVVPQARVGGIGGRAALGFNCGRSSCRCDGDDDCDDMFDTDVCGPTAFCYIGWVTGELVCICQR
jgi:hypothetical protein